MSEDVKDRLPRSFLCPISAVVMKDPVILPGSFQTVDRPAAEKWFGLGNRRCPVTNVELETVEMIPNTALRLVIEQWDRYHGRGIPPAFICPVTKFSMDDPIVIKESAQTVSRVAAVRWRKSGSYQCPVTGVVLKSLAMIENHSLRSAFEEWLGSNLENAVDCAETSAPLSNVPTGKESSPTLEGITIGLDRRVIEWRSTTRWLFAGGPDFARELEIDMVVDGVSRTGRKVISHNALCRFQGVQPNVALPPNKSSV